MLKRILLTLTGGALLLSALLLILRLATEFSLDSGWGLFVFTLMLALQLTTFVLAILPAERRARILPGLTSTETKSLEQYRIELERELEAETIRLDQRSRKLADRYRVIHEWMDYPPLLDLQSGEPLPGQPVAVEHDRTPGQSAELARQDRRVLEILDRQAEVIYEKIRKNSYSPNGPFQALLLRDDLLEMAERVAHVYQPQLENPLLSTTPEQIARALNRIGLHLLVVMDQLPLDLKSYNIQKTYETIRRAILTYGAYKKASPYLDWASKGIYVGRMVTTTNPIALGLLWGATELGKYGAQKLATQMIDRQAIGYLQSVIRVVGYEVAAIYGGDIRYRDPNWCYAVELTQMFATFPASRESLQYGLQELGRLQLRTEYDRLSLYRCLAAGKVIDRRQTYPDLLTEQEKKTIIELLEKAYRTVLHGTSSSQAEKWKRGVQEHLGLQLALHEKGPRGKQDQLTTQRQQLANFLAGYLLHIKQCDAALAVERLTEPATLHLLGREAEVEVESWNEAVQTAIRTQAEVPVFQLQPPDVDPQHPLVDRMLQLLCQLNASLPPYAPQAEQMLLETGLYYRRTSEQVTQKIDQAYQELAVLRDSVSAPVLQEASPAVSRVMLYLQNGEIRWQHPIIACYEDLKIHFHEPKTAAAPHGSPALTFRYVLLVGEAELVLVRWSGLETEPEILWTGKSDWSIDNQSSLLVAAARIRGGKTALEWHGSALKEILIQAPMTARFQHYFAPLLHQAQQLRLDTTSPPG